MECISFSTFRLKILHTRNIHRETKVEFCGYCRKLDSLDIDESEYPSIIKGEHGTWDPDEKFQVDGLQKLVKLSKLISHSDNIPRQFRYYKNMKASLTDEKSKAVIVQDFSQLELHNSFFQDLIISIYETNSQAPQNYHFIAPYSNIKNDIRFVIQAWIQLFNLKVLSHKEIEIWSDGGPKHFKISSCMYFFSLLNSLLPSTEIYYNFFVSNHGQSVCDGAAAHLKNEIRNYQAREDKPLLNPGQLLLLTLKNHHIHILEQIPQIEGNINVKPMKTIRSHYRFIFDKRSPGSITAMSRFFQVEDYKHFRVESTEDNSRNTYYFPDIGEYLSMF